MDNIYSAYHYACKTKADREVVEELAPKVIEAAASASFGNIGDIKYTVRTDVPNGGEWCDGAEYTQSKYPDLYKMLTQGKLQYVDIDTYNSVVELNGSCGLFGLDTANKKFRVPLLADVYLKAGQEAETFGAESLPNIRGTGFGRNNSENPTGACTSRTSTYTNFSSGSGYVSDFNASLSSPTYQDGAKVNPDHVKYSAYVILYSGIDLKADITKQVQLNNPFFFGMSMYFESDPKNASWLISNGAYHSGSVYKSFYNWLMEIYNGEAVDGVSVKSADEEYNDYDYVVNNGTFRLPLKVKKASGNAVVGNGMTLGLTDGTNNAGLYHDTVSGIVARRDRYGENVGTSANTDATLTAYKSVGITTDPTKSGIETSSNGLKLYFYVGETVQDANLIEIGKIMEQLAKIDYVVESKVATDDDPTWYRVYKSGWVEQGGETNIGIITYPKAFNDTNYNLQVTPHVNQSAQVYWNDFGYDLTTTGFKLRLDNYKTQWRACGQGA